MTSPAPTPIATSPAPTPITTSPAPTPIAQAVPTRRPRDWATRRRLAEDGGPSYSQGALALTYPLPSGLDCTPRSTALCLVQPPVDGQAGAPGSEAWAARFLQAVVEVVSSDRPLAQLVRWTDETVYGEIARRRQRVASTRKPSTFRSGRAQVVTVHIGHPTCDSAEVAARVSMGGRSRAIAARLDKHRDHWLCTAIQFG